MKKPIKRISGIYRIICKNNGRQYIGQAIDVFKRFQQHCSSLRNGQHQSKELQLDWLLYGEDSFVFEIMHEAEDAEKRSIGEQAAIIGLGKKSRLYNKMKYRPIEERRRENRRPENKQAIYLPIEWMAFLQGEAEKRGESRSKVIQRGLAYLAATKESNQLP